MPENCDHEYLTKRGWDNATCDACGAPHKRVGENLWQHQYLYPGYPH